MEYIEFELKKNLRKKSDFCVVKVFNDESSVTAKVKNAEVVKSYNGT